MRSGPIGLLGGLEHYEPTRPIHRTLLDEIGVFDPEVVILPLASFRRQARAAGALAFDHWTRLGARAKVVLPRSRFDPEAVENVAGADVIVLPGGIPNRLMDGLAATPLLAEISSRWMQGAGIAGSSAGAIVLFERRLNLYPPDPFRLVPGLGLLRGYVVAPHFDRLRVARWCRPFLGRLDGIGVIGIDESTGLVGGDAGMAVIGSGSVTLATGSSMEVYPAGSTIDIDLTSPTPGFDRPSSRSTPRRLEPAVAGSSPRW